ncbi:MAG TPA: hypothetical protein VFK07_01975, partial [Candidatus Paceibacterota bacterium]|nr:hypothetical protein [Candidatus Paceibacterota bacterium]
ITFSAGMVRPVSSLMFSPIFNKIALPNNSKELTIKTKADSNLYGLVGLLNDSRATLKEGIEESKYFVLS